jgi:acyltransferase
LKKTWIDVAKGIGIILVVLGHTASPPDGWICRSIFAFHMPFFFVIAGYSFNYSKYRGSAGRLLRNRSYRLVLPYVVAGLILCTYSLFVDHIRHKFSVLWVCVKALSYGTGYFVKQYPALLPIGTGWFIACLFVSTFVFYELLTLVTGRRVVIQWVAVVLVSSAGYVVGTRVLFLPWSTDIALTAQIFLFAGYQLRQVESKWPAWFSAPTIIVVLALLIIDLQTSAFDMNQRYYGNPLVTFPGAVAGSLLLIGVARKASDLNNRVFNEVFSYFGRASIVILLFHSQDVSHYLHWNRSYPYYAAITQNWPVWFLARMFCSVLVIELFRRVPLINRVFFSPGDLVFRERFWPLR